MKRTVLYCVTSSIILFIISFYFRDKIFDFFSSLFNGGNLHFVAHAANSAFLIDLKVSLSIATIPLILLISWVFGRIRSLRKRVFSVLIVTGLVALTIMVNVFRVRSYEIEMTMLPAQITYPAEKLFFEYAIGIGSILGAIISYFILRNKKQAEKMV